MVMIQNYSCPSSEKQGSRALSGLWNPLPLPRGKPWFPVWVCAPAQSDLVQRADRHLRACTCDGESDMSANLITAFVFSGHELSDVLSFACCCMRSWQVCGGEGLYAQTLLLEPPSGPSYGLSSFFYPLPETPVDVSPVSNWLGLLCLLTYCRGSPRRVR